MCISKTTPEQFQCIAPFLIPDEPYFQILLKIEAQIPVSVYFSTLATHRDRDLRTLNILLFLT